MYLSSFSFKLLTNTYLLINPFLLSTSIVHPAAIDESRYPTDQPNEFVWSQFLPPIIVGETSTIPYQHAILPRVTPKSEAPTDFQPIKASSTTTCCSSGHSQNRRSVSNSGSGVNSFISTYIDVAKCIVSCLLLLFAILPFASAQEGNDDSSFSMQDVTCLATAGLAVCVGLVGAGGKLKKKKRSASKSILVHSGLDEDEELKEVLSISCREGNNASGFSPRDVDDGQLSAKKMRFDDGNDFVCESNDEDSDGECDEGGDDMSVEEISTGNGNGGLLLGGEEQQLFSAIGNVKAILTGMSCSDHFNEEEITHALLDCECDIATAVAILLSSTGSSSRLAATSHAADNHVSSLDQVQGRRGDV